MPRVGGAIVLRRVPPAAAGGLAMLRARKDAIVCAFSCGNTEHVAYSNLPPGANCCHSASSILPWVEASRAMSLSRRSHLMSGWRLTTPEAVQGASSSMRSNSRAVRPAAGDRQSPQTTRASKAEARQVVANAGLCAPGHCPTPSARNRQAPECDPALPPERRRHRAPAFPAEYQETARRVARRRPAPILRLHRNPGPTLSARGARAKPPASLWSSPAMPSSPSLARYCAAVRRRRLTRKLIGG